MKKIDQIGHNLEEQKQIQDEKNTEIFDHAIDLFLESSIPIPKQPLSNRSIPNSNQRRSGPNREEKPKPSRRIRNHWFHFWS